MKNKGKAELILALNRSTGMTQADIKIVLACFLDTVKDYLKAGRKIEIRGFGTFYTKTRLPRPARNPHNGDFFQVPKRTVPLLKFSADIKAKLNKGGGVV